MINTINKINKKYKTYKLNLKSNVREIKLLKDNLFKINYNGKIFYVKI